MCGLRTVSADNPGASYCRLQLVFTPLFTPPSGPPWKAHKGTFELSRHPNELLVSNRCSCRYRHRYTRSAPTRFGHSRNFFFNPSTAPLLTALQSPREIVRDVHAGDCGRCARLRSPGTAVPSGDCARCGSMDTQLGELPNKASISEVRVHGHAVGRVTK